MYKFVTVKNTGKSNAYVRTIVAIEVGSTDGSLIGSSYHGAWDKEQHEIVNINGNNYLVFEYTYPGAKLSDGSYRHENGVLPAGDTTYPNLSQVYLNAEATNDDMISIDGNDNDKLDILVLSQAVQSDGFENAEIALNAGFGEVNAANVQKWFGTVGGDVPFADVTTLKADDTLTNSAGAAILGEGRKINATLGIGGNANEYEMDVVYQFEPTMSLDEAQKSDYRYWHADFVVSADKDVPAGSIGLAGYYDAWCQYNNNWVMLTNEGMEIPNGTEIPLVEAMSNGSTTVNYEDICTYGNDGIGFLCGAENLGGAEGITLSVELRLYETEEPSPENGNSHNVRTGEYVTAGTYQYTFK